MNAESGTIRVQDVALGDVIRPFGSDVTVIGTGGVGPGKWALQFTYCDGRRDSHQFDEAASVPLVKLASRRPRIEPEQLTTRQAPTIGLGLFECQFLHGTTGLRLAIFHVEAGTLPMARAIARVGWQGDGMDMHTLRVISVEPASRSSQAIGPQMQAKAFILRSTTYLRANARSVKALSNGAEQFNLIDGSFIVCDRWGNRSGFARNGWHIASATVREY